MAMFRWEFQTKPELCWIGIYKGLVTFPLQLLGTGTQGAMKIYPLAEILVRYGRILAEGVEPYFVSK